MIHAVQHSVLHCNAVWYNILRYDTIQNYIALYCTTLFLILIPNPNRNPNPNPNPNRKVCFLGVDNLMSIRRAVDLKSAKNLDMFPKTGKHYIYTFNSLNIYISTIYCFMYSFHNYCFALWSCEDFKILSKLCHLKRKVFLIIFSMHFYRIFTSIWY